jgi:cytosine/adenosine deaminase-related metal-dependent hydrolase
VIGYRAKWVLPIAAPPVRDGWVAVADGRIAGVGDGGDRPAITRDLGDVALLPGLVNAHTHLELSYLRNQVRSADTFIGWIRGVMAARRERPDPQAAEILDGVRSGIDEATGCGTALVGDISNTLVTVDPLRASTLGGVVFYELIRFNTPDAGAFVRQSCEQIDRHAGGSNVQVSLAAHAPYSVSPGVFRAIRDAVDRRPTLPVSVHLSEAREEVEFMASGQGAWRAFLEEIGSWDPAWVAPAMSPVAFLDETGFLDARVLAVHGVQMTAADLALLASRDTTLVTCPRSNQYTGAGVPPVQAFYEAGVRVAVGTDSLASTPELNLFSELAELRRLAPSVAASTLLASATIQGARALGRDDDYGTLEAGKRSRLLAARLPPAVADVEEYLVSGIEPGQLFWVDDPGQDLSAS